MAKINPEAKTKIIEALRSGKYTQGEGALRTTSGCFCVWGVICDVSGKGDWKPDGSRLAYGSRESTSFPSPEVEAWVGVADESEVVVEINGVTGDLMMHNDWGRTFAELAAAIEEQL